MNKVTTFLIAFVLASLPASAHAFKVGGLNWVTTDGAANQCMKTDGVGSLGWRSVYGPTDASSSDVASTLVLRDSTGSFATRNITLDGSLAVAGNVTVSGSTGVTSTYVTASTKITSPVFSSSSSTPATTGAGRFASSDSFCWRNTGNTTDECLSQGSSGQLAYNAHTVIDSSGNWVGGTVGATVGGTGQSTYTLGDMLYSSASNTLSKLAGNTTTTTKVLGQTGDGVNSAAPSWLTPTGTGSPVFSANPFITGTLTAAQGTFSSIVDVASTVRSTGHNNPSSGAGVEIDFNSIASSTGRIFAFDRTASARKDMAMDGLNTLLYSNGSVRLTVSSTGISTFSNTTDASSNTVGSIVIPGGVAIAKKLYVGSNIIMNGGQFGTNSTDSGSIMAIDNSQNQSVLSGTAQYGLSSFIQGTSAATSEIGGISSAPASAAASYTVASMDAFLSRTLVKGSGSTITNAQAFRCGARPTVGTNNACFSDSNSYTGNHFISQTGTSDDTNLAGPVVMSNASVKLTGVTTGTNADVLCLKSDGTVLIQAAGSCTISSRRFKEDISYLWESDSPSALSEVLALKPVQFKMKEDSSHKNADINFSRQQIGLIAEDVEKVDKRLALYEQDGVTPKSYRQESVIALLVGAMKEQQTQIYRLETELKILKKARFKK